MAHGSRCWAITEESGGSLEPLQGSFLKPCTCTLPSRLYSCRTDKHKLRTPLALAVFGLVKALFILVHSASAGHVYRFRICDYSYAIGNESFITIDDRDVASL